MCSHDDEKSQLRVCVLVTFSLVKIYLFISARQQYLSNFRHLARVYCNSCLTMQSMVAEQEFVGKSNIPFHVWEEKNLLINCGAGRLIHSRVAVIFANNIEDQCVINPSYFISLGTLGICG